MHCPFCQQPVTEESAQCLSCGLDLGKLDAVLGIAPVIGAGVTDTANLLTRRGLRQIEKALGQFRDRFPQIQVAVVFQESPAAVPLRTWCWWLFNRGNFSAALNQGCVNRDFLLAIDPVRRRSALTIGYGLEPFVSARDLTRALEAGQAALEAEAWTECVEAVLTTLGQSLQVIVSRMPRTYGIPAPLLLVNETGPAADPLPYRW